MTVGQELAWEIAEAKKENERRERDHRYGDGWREVETYRPYGNPGPGLVAEVKRYNKTKRECTFQWMRERQRYSYDAPLVPKPSRGLTRFRVPGPRTRTGVDHRSGLQGWAIGPIVP